MFRRDVLRVPWLLLCLFAPGSSSAGMSPVPAQQRSVRSERELEALGASLAAYLRAREADVGLPEAEAAVVASLKARAPDRPIEEALKQADDLGRALWLARDYASQKPRKGKVTTETLGRASFVGGELELAYRLPKDYDPRQAYPLILSLPAEGEGPAENLRTHWVLGDLLDHALLVSPALPVDPAEWTAVEVHGRPGGLCHLLAALRFAEERFALDSERIAVVGHGRSVSAALALGNYAPWRFAALAGRVGDAGDLAPDNFTNLPTRFAQGGERASAFRHGLLALGLPPEHCQLVEQDDEGALWDWLRAHPRRTTPEAVRLVVGQPFPTRAYWVRVAPSAPNARAEARIDRGANSILISTAGVSRVTLALNDTLLDLDRPVRLIHNGVEETLSVPRRLARTLEGIHDGTSDPGCVYVAELVFDPSGTALAPDGAGLEPDAEFDRRLAEAGLAPEALWALHTWCVATGRGARDARVLRRLLRVAPDHAEARAALGYHGEPGRWFASREAFERFQRAQQEEVARSKGLVLDHGLWIHREERAQATKGWVKDPPTGQWLGPGELRKREEGWARQDLTWIPPADAAELDDERWLVEGEWVDLATANLRHARLDSMWHVPSREVLVHSCADRAVVLRAQEHMARALEDLRKVFGAEPPLPLEVTLLRDEEQYDLFAFGDPEGRRPATDARRLHVVHSAFFAESWFQRQKGKLEYRGMGVCLWDPLAPNGDLFGIHAARLALGLSYVEALDPSPKAVRKAASSGPGADFVAAWEAEKLLPAWLRWGGAVYAERFFHDPTVGTEGDPWWARKWSRDSLAQRGGLRALAEVLACRIDPEDRDDGLRRLLEVGHVVSFVVDGDCAPVRAAHEELARLLAAGRLQRSQVDALTQALLDNEAALRAW